MWPFIREKSQERRSNVGVRLNIYMMFHFQEFRISAPSVLYLTPTGTERTRNVVIINGALNHWIVLDGTVKELVHTYHFALQKKINKTIWNSVCRFNVMLILSNCIEF